MANKLIVSLSPHVHSGDSVQKNMYGVIIALIPALLVSFYMFGLGAVIVTLTSVVACMFFEWAITKFILKRSRNTILDGSAALTGLLLAFNLPSNLPLWIIIIGALVAIGIGKMTFGGLGCNPFNPALVGRVFLLISFPVQMTSWPLTSQWTSYTDAATGATPLALMKQAVHGDTEALSQLPSVLDLFLGNNPGCVGEISAVALLLGLAYMLWKICRRTDSSVYRWFDVGSYFHGNRLCDFSDEPQGNAYLWCSNWFPDCSNPYIRCISGRYVFCYSHHECIYSAD